VNPEELLDVFHRRIRLPDADVIPGWHQETVGLLHRSYPVDPGPEARGFVESPRGLGDNPDAVIAQQVDYFRARGLGFEWKTYSYDEPADLGPRLIAAGLVPEEPETLILGDIDAVLEQAAATPSALPSKLLIRDIDQPEDFRRIADLMTEVWGGQTNWVHEQLASEQREYPERLVVSLIEDVTAGPQGPVLTAAWLRLHPGTGFASLWGGATRPEWRRRGLYRALLAHRARIAKDRGYDYLRVDASEDSRPILQRVGLHAAATTTPYIFTP
jgi:ribosomal protein S18 acetylase RimI-like enzyme